MSGGIARPPTVFYPSPAFIVLMVWVSAAFTACGAGMIWAGITGFSDLSVISLIAGALCAPLGAIGLFFFSLRLIRRRPELVLTDDGLSHRRCGDLAWDDVRYARLFVHRMSMGATATYVQLGLRDPTAYFARGSRGIRLVAKVNHRLGYGHLNLPESMLGASAGQVIAAMRHHHPDLVITL